MISQDSFFTHVLHGGDYNPDQWPETVWDEDVRLMQQAKWNIATLPVFGWAALQSDEETFHFEWLDRVFDKLHAGGIGVCLATATASVPQWLTQKYPEILTVNSQGQRLEHGGRHIFCPNSPQFKRLAAKLVTRIAERYGAHPALKIWHIGNEYGGNAIGGRCHCDLCQSAFRVWLEAKYGDLGTLNGRWDTAFWGKTYTNWEQIESPKTIGEESIQALSLDYDRFQSESLLGCYRAEAAIVRAQTPHIPVTTNMMGTFKPLDYLAWAQEVDVVSWDCYPRKGASFSEIGFSHALMRGLREGQPWLLMEQTPSQQNWQAQNSLKRPGIMRLWSYQALAHGAEAIMYFQWRRTRGGIEKFHGAVVEHAASTQARVFQEVAQLGAELEKLGAETLGGRVPAKVALLFDWENWWAVEYTSGPTRDLKYVEQCQHLFAALHEQGILCDIVSASADLSKYQVVVAPVLYMVKDGIGEKLSAFVKGGGTLLTTFFSGIADDCDSTHLGGYPGPLREVMGVWVEEVDALQPGETNRMTFETAFGAQIGDAPCGLLCERLHLEGATALATFGDDFYAGEPAFTVNDFGGGKAYYLASALEAGALKSVMRQVCAQAGVTPLLPEFPAGMEVMSRVNSDGAALIYLMNHAAQSAKVTLPGGEFVDLLTQTQHAGEMELPRYGVAILRASEFIR